MRFVTIEHLEIGKCYNVFEFNRETNWNLKVKKIETNILVLEHKTECKNEKPYKVFMKYLKDDSARNIIEYANDIDRLEIKFLFEEVC